VKKIRLKSEYEQPTEKSSLEHDVNLRKIAAALTLPFDVKKQGARVKIRTVGRVIKGDALEGLS